MHPINETELGANTMLARCQAELERREKLRAEVAELRRRVVAGEQLTEDQRATVAHALDLYVATNTGGR